MRVTGKLCIPDALKEHVIVTHSLAFLTLAAGLLPETFKDDVGVMLHHKPVSLSLNTWSLLMPSYSNNIYPPIEVLLIVQC